MIIRAIGEADRDEWLRMRTALWPDDHTGEADAFFTGMGHPCCVEVVVVERGDLYAGGAVRPVTPLCQGVVQGGR